MAIGDEVVFTNVYDVVDQFTPALNCAYLLGQSVEERSGHSASWSMGRNDIEFVRILEQEPTVITIQIRDQRKVVSLRSEKQLTELWSALGSRLTYLDITGLSHHVWAALLKWALRVDNNVKVVYVEPSDYTFSSAPTEGQIFDLSEKITGIAPLPGFASLASTRNQDYLFIPLLGFEGTRFSYIMETEQPSADRVIPIIGVPGFRPEYPFHTYLGNKRVLLETAAWHRVEYATANCPFGAFYKLARISSEFPNSLLRIAPIGTKPHALGAILFKLISHKMVELVYDHPIRKPKRTTGSDHLLVYDVAAFAESRGTSLEA
jgi:hypothetical protein